MVERNKFIDLKSVLLKDTIKEIKNTFKRFLSILLVVLLGVGFFAGIKAASPDMKTTIDKYFDEQNVMDIRVMSTLGLTDEDISTLKNVENVESVSGTYSQDVIVSVEGKESVIKLETIADEMNSLVLLDGKFPEKENECVVENTFLLWNGHKIGDNIEVIAEKISDDEGNKKEVLKQSKLKIVGVVKSPMYISRERGSSKLGSGKVNYYMYVSKHAVTAEFYTDAYIKVVGAKELSCYQKEYEDKIDYVKDKIEEISEERKQARYNSIYNKANNKIVDAQNKLEKEKSKAQKEIQDASKKINDAKKQIKNEKSKLENSKVQANKEFANADKKIKEAETTLNTQIQSFNKTKSQAQEQIKQNKMQLEALKLQGAPQNVILALENGIKKAENDLKNGENELKLAQTKLNNQKNILKNKKADTYSKIESAEKKIKKAENDIAKNEKKLKEAKEEANEKIADAEDKLEEAKLKLKDIKEPDWYILDRDQNTGYASYIQDADRVANIATVFPIVFFVVAALISLTSMSRMVEEGRMQIGTLKALGYTKIQIASKYIIYAMLATITGSVIGLIIGFNLLPRIVMDLYSMMYILPEGIIEFNVEYAVISVTLAMLCTVGAAVYSCVKELRGLPANLMRPKSPKPGKRVLIEKINFIWKQLSFTQKVTARNIFRYKKRFLMTIIGVMGCTALILAGFGLRDSISQMIPAQYGEIFKYNIQISLKDNITKKQLQEEMKKINDMEEISESIGIGMESIEITSIENTQNITLLVPENKNELTKYIVFRPRGSKEKIYSLEDDGIIMTEKLAKLLKIKEGDVIKIKNSDDKEVEVKVSNITENYLMHYIYMSPELYKTLYKEDVKINTIFANAKENLSEEELGHKILQDNGKISGVTFTSSTQNIFAEVMDNMNLVVWILIVSAGLLAFVVLYNLSNTNISERIRELATIKVLGFYNKEVYDYVSKETILLTLIGIVIGLFAGYFLTFFIVNTCELDILMFDKRVNFISYIYAIGITIVFAMIVNVATYFALKKIDMIESLKSIE